jgi:hypothetical protein
MPPFPHSRRRAPTPVRLYPRPPRPRPPPPRPPGETQPPRRSTTASPSRRSTPRRWRRRWRRQRGQFWSACCASPTAPRTRRRRRRRLQRGLRCLTCRCAVAALAAAAATAATDRLVGGALFRRLVPTGKEPILAGNGPGRKRTGQQKSRTEKEPPLGNAVRRHRPPARRPDVRALAVRAAKPGPGTRGREVGPTLRRPDCRQYRACGARRPVASEGGGGARTRAHSARAHTRLSTPPRFGGWGRRHPSRRGWRQSAPRAGGRGGRLHKSAESQ